MANTEWTMTNDEILSVIDSVEVRAPARTVLRLIGNQIAQGVEVLVEVVTCPV